MTTNSSAAILPSVYDYRNKTLNYYFAIDKKNREASTFGGYRDQINGNLEDNSIAAARELEEESLGVFGTRSEIKNVLRKYEKNGTQRISNRQLQNVTYIAPFEYQKASRATEFQNKLSQGLKNKTLSRSQQEIEKIVRVSADDLHQILENSSASKPAKITYKNEVFKIRNCVARTLQQAKQQNQLPTEYDISDKKLKV